MARKIIDLSVPLQNDVPADPPGTGPKIAYTDHAAGLAQMLSFFPGLKAEDGGRGDALAAGAGGAGHRHRRLELRCALRPYRPQICRSP